MHLWKGRLHPTHFTEVVSDVGEIGINPPAVSSEWHVQELYGKAESRKSAGTGCAYRVAICY